LKLNFVKFEFKVESNFTKVKVLYNSVICGKIRTLFSQGRIMQLQFASRFWDVVVPPFLNGRRFPFQLGDILSLLMH